jgi:hypothetical protein
MHSHGGFDIIPCPSPLFRIAIATETTRTGSIMQKPEKVPPDERPHGWQYPAGVVIILLMAFVAWLLLR